MLAACLSRLGTSSRSRRRVDTNTDDITTTATAGRANETNQKRQPRPLGISVGRDRDVLASSRRDGLLARPSTARAMITTTPMIPRTRPNLLRLSVLRMTIATSSNKPTATANRDEHAVRLGQLMTRS